MAEMADGLDAAGRAARVVGIRRMTGQWTETRWGGVAAARERP